MTRAVRVIDLITNLDMNGFQTHHGLQAFIRRLDHEVSICRKEQPFVIRPAPAPAAAAVATPPTTTTTVAASETGEGATNSLMDTTTSTEEAARATEGDLALTTTSLTIDDDGDVGKEYLTGV